MKAILINVAEKTIEAIEIDGDLDSMYKALGVRMIEVATRMPNGDCILVDEEGLLHGEVKGWFEVLQAHQPFAGNGLVVGSNGEDFIDCKSTVDEVKRLVMFPVEKEDVKSLTLNDEFFKGGRENG